MLNFSRSSLAILHTCSSLVAYCKCFSFQTDTSDFVSIAHYMLVLLSAQFLNLWHCLNLFCFRGENKDIYIRDIIEVL